MISIRQYVHDLLTTQGVPVRDLTIYRDIDVDTVQIDIMLDLPDTKIRYGEAKEITQQIIVVGRDHQAVRGWTNNIVQIITSDPNTNLLLSEVDIERSIGDRGRWIEVVISATYTGIDIEE